MDCQARIARLRDLLGRRKLDAILISQPENRRYLSGYTAPDHGISETSGLLLVLRKGKSYLLTDFRYKEQCLKEAEDCEVLLSPKGYFDLLGTLLPDLSITSLAFEAHYSLHTTAEKLFTLGRKLQIKMVPLTGLVENLRRVKSKKEIELIRRSVLLNEKVFQRVFKKIGGELTEIEVALLIAAEMRLAGAENESFPTIVAAGSNSSLPHAVPGRKKIGNAGPLVIDMGLILEGYCSDMTRSFYHGRVDDTYRDIHRVVRKAQLAALAAVRAGSTGREVDGAARRVISKAGYGKYFGHSVGHGVGMAVHEEPRVSSKSRKKLKAGMVITIEPGIYIPGWGGVRLENMVVVKEDGCENLNSDTTWLDI
ncbi:MAG: aminopeptidase P family protein [Desulfopila sp.]|jgi:Xaa-Pro aminopeptidase|nr:aminopeptidase P family protein [Desulfopila sp.]